MALRLADDKEGKKVPTDSPETKEAEDERKDEDKKADQQREKSAKSEKKDTDNTDE